MSKYKRLGLCRELVCDCEYASWLARNCFQQSDFAKMKPLHIGIKYRRYKKSRKSRIFSCEFSEKNVAKNVKSRGDLISWIA